MPLKDLCLRTRWKPGSATDPSGPLLVSFTQFTPHRLRDLFEIWRASDCLGDELVRIDSAVGVVTYFQPARRRVGSLSAWTCEAGLAEFVRLPYHREIMRKYRPRGQPLRSVKWWADEFRLGFAMAEGQRLLHTVPLD